MAKSFFTDKYTDIQKRGQKLYAPIYECVGIKKNVEVNESI